MRSSAGLMATSRPTGYQQLVDSFLATYMDTGQVTIICVSKVLIQVWCLECHWLVFLCCKTKNDMYTD